MKIKFIKYSTASTYKPDILYTLYYQLIFGKFGFTFSRDYKI